MCVLTISCFPISWFIDFAFTGQIVCLFAPTSFKPEGTLTVNMVIDVTWFRYGFYTSQEHNISHVHIFLLPKG